jgi:hypothetical protein
VNQHTPDTLDLKVEDLHACMARIERVVAPTDFAILQALLLAYLFVRQALSAAKVSVARLKRLFFGARTEKSRDVLPKDPGEGGGNADKPPGTQGDDKKAKPKRKGHGRNGATAYPAAQKVPVRHPKFYRGCPCPDEHCTGKVYLLKKRGQVLRIIGQAPLKATLYEPERWRCNLCERITWAQLPADAGDDKYHATAVAMIAILHFANGFPFHRLERFQASLGIPLPASAQYGLLREAYEKLLPVLKELIRCAAQSEILHNDDTGMKIVDLLALIENPKGTDESSSKDKKKRTGIHTTGIVAITAAYLVVLYFTGRKHAGENLADVLQKRDPSLPDPIHMADGLDHNDPGNVRVKSGKCLTHGRRQFVDIVTAFPEECRRVVDDLGKVYHVDAIAKKTKLSSVERLLLHQEKSTPVMDGLRRWFTDKLLEREVEPNSGLGRAIKYMLKRWDKLTLFLREPGAPLDNNVAERILKMAIRHRKNSLFYKTGRGAAVGDLFMSIIETCARNGVDAFEYLTALLENVHRARENPGSWMPWNYRAMLRDGVAQPETEGPRETSPDPAVGPRPPFAEPGAVQADAT